jgi:pSer/pThr/pTyr-binding forkhead associated (FHA) protein
VLLIYKQLSAQNTKFIYTEDGLVLEDMGSRNGTFLRLSEVGIQSEPVRLYSGRVFRLGEVKYFTCD